METQSFELRRLPRFKDRNSQRLFWLGVGFLVARNSVLSWCALACLAGWVIYRLRGPTPKFLLSETEMKQPGDKHPIQRHEVEEIYPSTHGLTVAWKRHGVPHYSEIHAVLFEADVWSQVRAALLAWGNPTAESPRPVLPIGAART